MRKFLALAALTAATMSAFAQDRELTVEELFLRDIEFQVLKEQAFSDDRESKILVLSDLQQMIQAGDVAVEDVQIQFVLEYLSLEGTTMRILEGRSVINNFPEVRRQAIQLLGEIGSDNSLTTIIAVLLRDEESMVRAEAAFALGEIGSKDQPVLEALVVAVDRMDPVTPDNTFAFATIVAFEKIARANSGISDPDAIRALVQLAQGNYFRKVRNRALQVLKDLRDY